MDKNKTVKYFYRFKFSDGRKITVTIHLQSDRMKLVKPVIIDSEKPKWTKLGYYQCSNCTLDETEYAYCPAAENLVTIIDVFKDVPSTEIVEAAVQTPEREMRSKLQIQGAISSLMGIYMAISDCPVLRKFAPMAKFHLPFATLEETMYRTISNYLLAQYFIYMEEGKPDWKLDGLRKFYDEVEMVNVGLCNRIRSISPKDANINAVVVLDNFAKNITYLIDNVLESIKPMFKDYIDEAKNKNTNDL